MRAWSSLVTLRLIPDTLTKLPSSCLPSLIQSRVYRLRAWGILANIERLLYPLELLCWLTFTEALSCSIEHVINILRVWHAPKMLSQLTLPRHRCLATWQPLTEPSQPRKMGATSLNNLVSLNLGLGIRGMVFFKSHLHQLINRCISFALWRGSNHVRF